MKPELTCNYQYFEINYQKTGRPTVNRFRAQGHTSKSKVIWLECAIGTRTTYHSCASGFFASSFIFQKIPNLQK